MNDIYRISTNKFPVFNFNVLRCGAYWRAALKRGRRLFPSKRNYLNEISKVCNFLYPNNNK